MAAYYNELDPFAAAWLRELIKAGLIADGEVDERSIELVQPDDLRGFVQCHFFAGIGGWSLALRLAGWDDSRAVWTGSCPCQPFSSAGAQAGGHDPRDLWPVWFQLVKECRPSVVFGEQVEAAIGHGWLDRLCDDLETEDYAVGACGLPGPCVGAFDIRQRLWFVAESNGRNAVNGDIQRGREHGLRAQGGRADGTAGDAERAKRLDDAAGARRDGERQGPEGEARHDARMCGPERGRTTSGLADSKGDEQHRSQRHGDARRRDGSTDDGALRMADTQHAERRTLCLNREDGRDGPHSGRTKAHGELGTCGEVRDVGNASGAGLAECGSQPGMASGQAGRNARETAVRASASTRELADASSERRQQDAGSAPRDESSDGRESHADHEPSGDGENFWSDVEWIACADGKARPTQPGLFPLVARLPGELVPSGDPSLTYANASTEARVGRLRGYGNSIKAQVAAEVIAAYMETVDAWDI